MGQIVFDGEGKVSANRARGSLDWICRAHHGANGLDGVLSLDGQSHNGTAGKVVADRAEKGPFPVLIIMGLNGASLRIDELKCGDFKASSLDALQDFSDEVAADSAGLDQDESGLWHGREGLYLWAF